MKLGHSPRVFGASLRRLASPEGGELLPSGAESAAVAAKAEAIGNVEQGAAPEPRVVVEREWEADLLEMIRSETESLSADCRAPETRPSEPVAPQLDPLDESPGDESEYELLDVDPASIDEYMHRLLARVQRTPARRPEATEPRRLFTPAISAGPQSFAAASLSATARPDRDAASLALPVTERPEHLGVFSDGERTPSTFGGDSCGSREKLREIIERSTGSTRALHVWRRHRLMLIRKLLPVFQSLALAGILYAAHFLYGAPLKPLAWGSTAIGLVALLGMVHLWSRAARKQARLHARVSGARRKSTKTMRESGAPSASFVTPR